MQSHDSIVSFITSTFDLLAQIYHPPTTATTLIMCRITDEERFFLNLNLYIRKTVVVISFLLGYSFPFQTFKEVSDKTIVKKIFDHSKWIVILHD